MTSNERGLDKYNIGRKADFIRLTILLHDLECFNEDLQEPIKDAKSYLRKYRNTRNVFVSLHNVKDAVNEVRVDSDEELVSQTRALRKQLQFVGHVRNKGVGHLDNSMLKRAAQWQPHIFYDRFNSTEDVSTFLCYKGLLEASINSYDGGKGHFASEIDLTYPPDLITFYDFLSKIVNDSIRWIQKVRVLVAGEIEPHTKETLIEHAIIAGNTNFDLKSESSLDLNHSTSKEKLNAALEKLRERGGDVELLNQLADAVKNWEV